MSKIKDFNNISCIYQPHFMSNCFRVACNKQQGKDFNYIIVTCSPEFNGIWKYPASICKDLSIWLNGKRPCYCVPIEKCTKYKDLDSISNPNTLKEVAKMQARWYASEVKNRDYVYKAGRPEWMLNV